MQGKCHLIAVLLSLLFLGFWKEKMSKLDHSVQRADKFTHITSLTQRLVEGGNQLSLPVIDHIILGDRSFYSFDEHSLLTHT